MHVERRAFAATLGALGLAGAAAGFARDSDAAALAYLAAWTSALSLAAGALALLMIGRVTGAIWFVALRRPVEAVSETLPLLAVLFLPIALSHGKLFPWPRPGGFDGAAFFVARSILWLAVLSWLALAVARARSERRARALSAIGLPVLGIAFTGGSIDWLLALDRTFASTLHAGYVLAGGFETALAFTAIVLWAWRGARAIPETIGPDHFHALGKLLLTAAIFWAYLAYAQGLIVWIADLPRDSAWYVVRVHEPWGTTLALVVLGRFVLPFLLLLPRGTKRAPAKLATVSAVVVVAHALDAAWLVLPREEPPGAAMLVLFPVALVGVAGTSFAFVTRSLRGRERIPVEDPRLAASLRYESP